MQSIGNFTRLATQVLCPTEHNLLNPFLIYSQPSDISNFCACLSMYMCWVISVGRPPVIWVVACDICTSRPKTCVCNQPSQWG